MADSNSNPSPSFGNEPRILPFLWRQTPIVKFNKSPIQSMTEAKKRDNLFTPDTDNAAKQVFDKLGLPIKRTDIESPEAITSELLNSQQWCQQIKNLF